MNEMNGRLIKNKNELRKRIVDENICKKKLKKNNEKRKKRKKKGVINQ